MVYERLIKGQPDTLEYKVYLTKDGKKISPFHDVPLYADKEKKIFNMVVEIPRWTNAKLEVVADGGGGSELIKTGEAFNPIVQDVKNGKLRYVKNTFPHLGYIWNYGAFPQTWEDPGEVSHDTGCKGDKDPVDVLEIGEKLGYAGQVKQVKVLGVLALIDEGETDWKILAIDVTDPLAAKLNDIEDIQEEMPGLLKATVEWFRLYKVPDGKKENEFAFGGNAKGRDFALNVIEETHAFWNTLIQKPSNTYGISTVNSTLSTTPSFEKDAELSHSESEDVIGAPKIDQALYKWYYYKPKY
ncbi:Inorganic pyrophosphatase [Zancudomyces culisetae]|uniref:Inorganic pyrophosphatase n=1 Tax=Zancudomyces culisetae TaxID=1213189 RepID=A0A1R1PKA7_ZANCU|nr:Inorganic pyrophosphatase [Zancudomyces culisetae]|eukprot:OMH81377.1 Inorganic pyrophosphatase [Zancudomyces culisetae]